jgi:hypothetical protein
LFWSPCLVAFLLASLYLLPLEIFNIYKMGIFYILFKEAAHVRQGSQISNQTKVSSTKTPQLFLTHNLWTKESKLLKDQKYYAQIKTKWAHLLSFAFVVEEVPSGLLLKPLLYLLLFVLVFRRLGLCVGAVDM